MMRMCLLAVVGFGLVLSVGCSSFQASPKVSALICKMEKAVDPNGKMASVSTEMYTGIVRDTTKDKGLEVTVRIKHPNMLRIDIKDAAGGNICRAFDGKTGWHYASGGGHRLITGRELDNLKFSAAFLSPFFKFRQVFDKAEMISEEVKVGEHQCYELRAYPKASLNKLPVVIYVDKDTNLIAKTVEPIETDNGVVKLVRVLGDYKDEDGIMFPMHVALSVDGNVMDFEVSSVEWNEPMDVSAFDPPEVFELEGGE